MSFFSFLNSHKEEIALVFDIGSGTLGGALVKFHKHTHPQILYSYREHIVTKRNVDSETLTDAMLKVLDTVSATVMKDGLAHLNFTRQGTRKIQTVYFVFSSPWVISQTKVITINKDKETLVTHEIIERAVKDEEQMFENLYKEGKFAEKFEYDVDIIERNVSQISLNGYITHDPYMKFAHRIDIPFFMSVISKKILVKMNSVVSKYFHFTKSISHSCVFLSYITLRDLYHDEHDFLLIDIHGELTDIGVIKDGVLIQTASFPLGVNTIMRKVSKELATTPKIGESQVKLFLEGKSENKTAVVMKNILNKIKREWIQLLHESLDNLNVGSIIPQKLFLVVDSGMGNFFTDFIKEEKFDNLHVVSNSFNVTVIDSTMLGEFGSWYSKHERDSYLAIHTLAINKFREHEFKPVL